MRWLRILCQNCNFIFINSVFKLEGPAEKDRAFKIKKGSSGLEVPHGSPFIYSPHASKVTKAAGQFLNEVKM